MTADGTLVNALSTSSGTFWIAKDLCMKCQPIANSKGNSTHQHWTTSREIRDSAYRGCHMCSLMHGAFPLVRHEKSQPSSAVRTDGPWEVECSFDPSSNLEQRKIIAYVSEKRNQSLLLKLNVRLTNTSSICSDIGPGGEGWTAHKDSTGASESLKTAKQWLENCLRDHHSICGVPKRESDSWLPTRLIHIGNTSCRLVESSTYAKNVKYLILSYCWGVERQDELKLTANNYQQLLAEIEFGRLPKTIAEAVITTKKLGYDHLWVDRLCIIQGDDSDWKFEAQRMQAYYMFADCSIAALVAEDVHQGLYTKRNPLLMQPLRTRSSHYDKDIHISSVLGGAMGHYPRMYRGPPYVLSERAWVLQERLLAPRTIYFGSLMLYWECRRARFTEHDPLVDLDLPFALVMRKFGSRAAVSSPGRLDRIEQDGSGKEDIWVSPIDEATMNNMQDRWADMVELYTKCSMRYPAKDRLIAITGMINSITAQTGHRFVHGLLAACLPTELLWWQWVRCEGDISVRPQRLGDTTRTPTWSWASVKGDVAPFWSWKFLQRERREAWQTEIEAQTVDLDIAVAKSLAWVTTANPDPVCKIRSKTVLVETFVGDRIDLKHYCWTLRAVIEIKENSYRCFSARIWPDEVIAKGQTVWLLRAAVIVSAEMSKVSLAGLVVLPVSSHNRQYWRRIGYWHSQSGISVLDDPSEAEKACADRTMQLAGELSFTPLIYLL